MTGLMAAPIIGWRTNGTPIRLITGGADDDGETSGKGLGVPTPAPAAPPTPPPGPGAPVDATADDSAALRDEVKRATEEREALMSQIAQLQNLLSSSGTATVQDDEDEEEPRKVSDMSPAERKLYREVKSLRLEAKQKREQVEAQMQEAAQKQKEAADRFAAEEARRKLAEDLHRDATASVAPMVIEARATPALIAAGADAKQAEILARYLDHSKLTVDPKARQVSGLDEEITRLKTELPQLFAQPESERRSVPRVATGDRAPVETKPERSADVLARQILGGAA